jgi:hypothetical protein
MFCLLGLLVAGALADTTPLPDEVVGERPYEMVWAGRDKDDHPALIDFEDLTGWAVECTNAEASFRLSREQQLFGSYVGKLTYRAAGTNPTIRILPPAPIKIDRPFDACTMWVYGNNWAYSTDPTTPSVNISLLFADANGQDFTLDLIRVAWKEWFLCHRRLPPDLIKRVEGGAQFKGFQIAGGRNAADRVLYFDSFATFTEAFPPLTFEPRPERGIPMFPGQGTGTNTGPGKLPFPTRLQTILPTNLTTDFRTSVGKQGDGYEFTYEGADGKLVWRYTPKTGMLGDITAQWSGRGEIIRPCAGGGVYLAGPTGPLAPEKAESLGTTLEGEEVRSRWRLTAGDRTQEVTYTLRLWAKSLVVDVVSPGGGVQEVRYGLAQGLATPRAVPIPYYRYNGRPGVAVGGSATEPLFLAGASDWYLTNASELWGACGVDRDGVAYNGGCRYIPLTNGQRNDCYERLFLTLSPRFEEVLPTVDNPPSPWKSITGTRVWRAHGAGNRDADKAYWTKVHRYGMTEIVVTDHETMWRDGGESFTFRTRTAPKKGGQQGAADYSRFMQQDLGFTYGPYNNFTDFAPVNEYWSADLISRTPGNDLQRAWARCYAPKPARAVEYCAKLSPINQEKYHFSTAYCDVHTAVPPWGRTDYDSRVPGAGTLAAVFYSYGEIMLLQKAAWKGPVYSEGNYHWMYCGLTDGNYGQDQSYNLPNRPWLVDFDLLKLHPLCCNFGMGNPGMFYGRETGLGKTTEEIDRSVDRFLAATVAFGHPGFLVMEGGMRNGLRSYFMLQALHSRYCLSDASEIRYADASGKLLPTSEALATDAYQRSQVATRYADGTVTVANGSPTERMKVNAWGHTVDLPPNGYAGWSGDGAVEAFSGDRAGRRADYCVSPAYLYVDGRGRFTRFAKAASNGQAICRILGDGKYEIIPFQGSDCGFAIPAGTAVALDEAGKELGPAEVRTSRGLTHVMPVAGAFSYLLTAAGQQPTALRSDRDVVVAGETVAVLGRELYTIAIPRDARPGQRIWQQLEGQWIDFTVAPLTDAALALEGNTLEVTLVSNLPRTSSATVTAAGKSATVALRPGVATVARLNLGEPPQESAGVLTVDVAADGFTQRLERGMRVEMRRLPLVSLPERYQAGMCLRGKEETTDMGDTRATVDRGTRSSGDVARVGILMHPPYVGGVGYAYALYDPVALPADRPAAFRALVGKGDGSDVGDGILYKVAVVCEGTQTVIGERVVNTHAWLPIEGDLTPWAGKTVQIKIISDVGTADNSSGDWACWADMKIESLKESLVRELDEDTEAYRRAPGPFPVVELTQADLRAARSGWLHYDGKGLSGTGEEWGSFAVLNGVELGNMAPAGGREAEGIFQEDVKVPLTAEAIAALKLHNTFALRNPRGDSFSVRRFWIELELGDGRKASSQISTATYSQPGTWLWAEGIGVPLNEDITLFIDF